MVFAPSWADEELGSSLTVVRNRALGPNRPPEDDPFAVLMSSDEEPDELVAEEPALEEQRPQQSEAPPFTQDAISAAQGQEFEQAQSVIDAYTNALQERETRSQLIDTGLPAYDPVAIEMQGGSAEAHAQEHPPISYEASFED